MRRFTVPLAVAAVAATATLVTVAGPAGPAAAADCSGGYVALTYDDGPTTGTTTSLLNALKAANARATFFIWGDRAQANQSLLRNISDAGMWLGNHSYTHPTMTSLSSAGMTDELTRTQNVIRTVTGRTPVLFRPPYGSTSATLRSAEAGLGLTEILWDVDSGDWNSATTDQIVAKAAALQAGQVMLMHDGYQTTVNAVPRIVSGLAGRRLCPGMISPTTGRAVAPTASTTTTMPTTTMPTTTMPTLTVPVTRTTTTTPPGTRTPTPTVPGGGSGAGACTARYAVASSWNGGFVASVTVSAGSALRAWTVTLALPAGSTVSTLWNGTASGTSGTVTVRNATYNSTLSAGQSTAFGFQGMGSGAGVTASCSAG